MKKKQNKKILFTGGHFTAAFAVIASLEKSHMYEFAWVGHKYTMLQDKEPSFEYKEVTKKGIPFYNITTGKLYRHISYLGLISLLRIPIGFIQSFILLLKLRPSLIVSFGGYLAVPVACSAYLLHIPIITHEQTVTVGLSNRIIARFATAVLLAWKSSEVYFPKKKTFVVGNPIRPEVFIHDKPFHEFNNDVPTILIMGGNQGSHAINMLIKDVLPELITKYNVIHQTGSNTIHEDYEKLAPLMQEYPNYFVSKGIWGDDIGRAFHQASIVMTRSGANTVYELAALHKKAICIPLPYAVNNEQYKNAEFLVHNKLGVILEEKDLSQKTLFERLDTITSIKVDESTHLVLLDAVDQIVTIIKQY